jgi:hypothetical protein
MMMVDRKLVRFGCVLLALASALGAASADPAGRRTELDAIARQCGFPPSVLELKGGQLHMRPPANASYPKVHCLIVATRKAGFHTPMAFVVRETFDLKAR